MIPHNCLVLAEWLGDQCWTSSWQMPPLVFYSGNTRSPTLISHPLYQKWPVSPLEKLREKSPLKISRSPLRLTYQKVWQSTVRENRGHRVWGHLSWDKKPVETEPKTPFPNLWAIIFLPHLTLYVFLLDHKGKETVFVQCLRQKRSKQPKEEPLWMVSPSRQGQEDSVLLACILASAAQLAGHTQQPTKHHARSRLDVEQLAFWLGHLTGAAVWRCHWRRLENRPGWVSSTQLHILNRSQRPCRLMTDSCWPGLGGSWTCCPEWYEILTTQTVLPHSVFLTLLFSVWVLVTFYHVLYCFKQWDDWKQILRLM